MGINPYMRLKDAAKKYADAVSKRRETTSGSYPKDIVGINAADLRGRLSTADQLGYETHVRLIDGVITLFNVAKLPQVPYELL